MEALDDRSARDRKIRDLEVRLKNTRSWLVALGLAVFVLIAGAWMQEAQEIRTERLVVVDPESGAEGRIRVEGRDLILEDPGGSRTVLIRSASPSRWSPAAAITRAS